MSYSYKDQVDTLKSIKLKEGDALRIDCPFCGGRNTFGISRNGGKTSWGCFRASCGSRGTMAVGYTKAGILFKLGFGDKLRASNDEPKKIPEPLVSIARNDKILDWLKSVNSLKAYNDGLVDITYSPTEDRVMFRVAHPDSNLIGYTGRTLNKFNGPKWMKYGDCSDIFTVGFKMNINGQRDSIGVIVEDAPSACAVGVVNGLTGIALLGTNLTTQHKVSLRQFSRLIVCLDPDAARKGIGLARRLEGVSNVSTKLIKDDLKYYRPEQIKEMLCLD